MTPSAHSSAGVPRLRWFLVVVVLVVVAYANSFTAEFQFDDYEQIWESPIVHENPSVGTVLQWGRTRLVPYLTLVGNYYLGGDHVFGYHVVNLLIHLLVCLVVYLLIGELCQTPRLRGTWTAAHALPIALAAAIVVGCHPLQVQAVTYVVQRMSSLAALFYLATVYLYVRFRNADAGRALYVGAIGCAIAAYLSKENAASLPLALVLTEWAFFRPLVGRQLVRRLWPFFVLVLLIPIIFRVANIRPLPKQEEVTEDQTAAHTLRLLTEQARRVVQTLTVAAEAPEELTPWAYFLTQCRVIPYYLGLVVVPSGLTIDHDVPTETALGPWSAAGMAFLIGLAALGVVALGRFPLLGFGILWIFVALSVESTIFPIPDVMNEHRMYLAMPGVAVVIGLAFAWLAQRQRILALTVGGVVAITLVMLTIARNEVWATQLTLWGEALRVSPNKARVHVNYGTALHLKGEVKEAVKHYCEALRLQPSNRRAESNINVALDDLMDQDEVDMELATVGPDGETELVPRHPCPPKKP